MSYIADGNTYNLQLTIQCNENYLNNTFIKAVSNTRVSSENFIN